MKRPEATQTRARRFNQTDLGVLAKIRQGLNDRIPADKIKEELGTVVQDPREAERELVEYEPINKVITSIRSDVTGILERLEMLEKLEAWPRLPWYKRIFGRPPK